MMAAATVDMNQKIILINLDMIEEQRRQMHDAVNQYVDKVTDAGMKWTTRKERSHSTFLDIQKIISRAMAYLSLKCEEMKSELESETSNLIGRDELTQQQKNAQMDSVAKPATTHGKGKEDGTDDVKKPHSSRNPNLESDQQTRYQDVYNQLRSVLAKQDELEQQLNMKLNNLREDTESLKSGVGTFNQYVETGKTLLNDYSQKLETLENTVSCLSEKCNEMYSDQQLLFDRINSHLSDKDDPVNRDLSAKVDQITTHMTDKVDQVNKDLSAKVCQMNKDLTAKVGQINTDFSAKVVHMNTDLSAKVNQINTELSHKVDEINTDLSSKVDQINLVLQTLVNSEKKHAAQMNKIINLEKHVNTIEKDTQNNNKDLSAKVRQMNTDLSAKVDQINVVLQTLTNSEKKHAAQMNKIIDLEKHVNTMKKDTQNNDKQVQQRLEEVGRKLIDMSQKLTQLSVEVVKKRGENLSNKVDQVNTDLSTKVDQINVALQALTNSEKEHAAQMNKIIDLEKHFNDIAQQQHDGLLDVTEKLTQLSVEVDKKRDIGAVGFTAATTLKPGVGAHLVGMFEPPAFIAGCQFNSDSGHFTASSGGVYLAYVSACLDKDGTARVYLIHGHSVQHTRDREAEICSVQSEKQGSTMCSLGMVEMKVGDKLFIRKLGYHNCSCQIKFLCFRIG